MPPDILTWPSRHWIRYPSPRMKLRMQVKYAQARGSGWVTGVPAQNVKPTGFGGAPQRGAGAAAGCAVVTFAAGAGLDGGDAVVGGGAGGEVGDGVAGAAAGGWCGAGARPLSAACR